MAIDNEALMMAIDIAKERAYGTDEHSDLGDKRARAINYYLGANTNPAPEGRSQVVDRSVYETIQTMLPSLVRIFASSNEEICKVVPVGPEDEQAAEQTTAVLNHVVTEQNRWEQICADWIHDSLLLCNGYAMAYWDESDRRVREVYEAQSDDQFAALVNDDAVTVLQHSQRPDTESNKAALQAWQAMTNAASAAGQPGPPRPMPQYLHDVVIERAENDGKVCIKVLPPEHCYISADTPDWTMTDCPYFEVRQQKTIADLRAMGLEVADDVSDDADSDALEDDARDRFAEEMAREWGEDMGGAMRLVWARMIWVRADVEGDGQSRLYYVIAVGKTILYSEPCARMPVASMTPQPMPHRHIGMSVAETVEDIQDIRTAVTRGGLDNLYLINAGRHAVSSRVNLEDFLDARPGGIVRMLDDSLPTEGHIMPLVHPVAFDQIIGSLQYFDEIRQNRTGAARTVPGADAGVLNKTASGMALMQNAASMRVEHIARMMAPAVEHLFSIVHELIAKHQQKPLAMKLKGQWTYVDPQAWRTKRDVRISVGVGAGNKESMMGQLAQIFGAQLQLVPLGLAGPQQIHASVTEMAKLAGFANPAKFWTDPQQIQQQQPQPTPEQVKAQADMQKEQFKAQQDAMKFQAEQALERERLSMQAQVDQQREEMQARQKALEAQQAAELESLRAQMQERSDLQRLEFERWKVELDAAVKLQIAQMSKPAPDGRADVLANAVARIIEVLDAPTEVIRGDDGRAIGVRRVVQQREQPIQGATVEQVAQAVQELIEDMSEPTEIVRDPGGRATGIKRGKRVRTINRGPDGRAIGVQ